MIAAIAARGENGIIGTDNDLPWDLPADRKYFRDVTNDHPVIMGRKTAESIHNRLGYGLPGRQNIVVTHDEKYLLKGFIVANTIEDALMLAGDGDAFIIGGAQIYEQAMPYCDKLYITEVHASPSGDAYFPQLDPVKWQESSRESYQKDEKNQYDFDFVVYDRVR